MEKKKGGCARRRCLRDFRMSLSYQFDGGVVTLESWGSREKVKNDVRAATLIFEEKSGERETTTT